MEIVVLLKRNVISVESLVRWLTLESTIAIMPYTIRSVSLKLVLLNWKHNLLSLADSEKLYPRNVAKVITDLS